MPSQCPCQAQARQRGGFILKRVSLSSERGVDSPRKDSRSSKGARFSGLAAGIPVSRHSGTPVIDTAIFLRAQNSAAVRAWLRMSPHLGRVLSEKTPGFPE